MFLVSQDRDEIIEFTDNGDNSLISESKWYNSTLIGFNLLYKDHLLGTFDTAEEVIKEMHSISQCEEELYYVTGFSDYTGWEDWNALVKLMAESEADQ